jgi:hypothetical protein
MHTARMLTVASFILFTAASTVTAQQNDLHAIVEVKEGCVIGGVQNRQWVAAEKFENSILFCTARTTKVVRLTFSS